MKKPPTELSNTALIYLCLASLFWSLAFFFTDNLNQVMEPIEVVTYRLGVASLFFVGLIIYQQHKVVFKFKIFYLSIATAFISSLIPFFLFAYSMKHGVSPAAASILNSTGPLWTLVISLFVLRESVKIHKMVGLLVGIAGLLIFNDIYHLGSVNWLDNAKGGQFILMATLCYAVAGFISRGFYGSGIAPAVLALYQTSLATVFALIITLVSFQTIHLPVSGYDWFNILGVGIFCSGVATLFMYKFFEVSDASNLLLSALIIPIFSNLISLVLYFAFNKGRLMSFHELLGAIIIGGSILIISGKVKLPWFTRKKS